MTKEWVIAVVNQFGLNPFYDVIFRKHGYHGYVESIPVFDRYLKLEYRDIRPEAAVSALYSCEFDTLQIIREDYGNRKRFYRVLCPAAWYPKNAGSDYDIRHPENFEPNRQIRRGGSNVKKLRVDEKTGRYL